MISLLTLRLKSESKIKSMRLIIALWCFIGLFFFSRSLGSQERDAASFNSAAITRPEHIVVLRLSSVLIQDGANWIHTAAVTDPDVFKDVDTVELEGDINSELISFVSKIENLRSLTVHEQPRELDLNGVLRPLAGAKNLRVLNLTVVEISPRPCSVLGELTGLEQLQLDFLLSQEDFHAISLLPNLHTLDLMGVDPEPERDQRSKRFSYLANLTVRTYSDLSYFENADQIRSLHVRQAFTESHLKELKRFSGLENLEIMVDSAKSMAGLQELLSVRAITVNIRRGRGG